ncbi:hAT family dimerization protein [Ceratobasidium sp. AG-Ba]|nr:hAT family dimerization protein [Ceratobasidium sp. AG-Ba]
MSAIPTTPIRNRRPRRHGLNALTDIEAWSYSDDEIIAASFSTWRSQAYKHYKVYLERRRDEQGNPKLLMYRFECKHSRPSHLPQYRERMKTGNGTRNLQDTADTCNARWGVTDSPKSSSNFFDGYSEARHRVLIALRCAQNKRAFNSVSDRLYRQEVEMLRPGTTLPSPITVSRDMQVIYANSANGVKEYFKNIRGALHFAIDGWTSPQSSSFLGLVVIWHSEGRLWRSILEFVHLTHAHKGEYLASRIEDCLKRYGISHKVLSICLDNASNNDTLVESLARLIPSFRGPRNRVRCLAHIINLMAKAFLSLFTRPPRRKKAAEPSKQQALTASSAAVQIDQSSGDIEEDTDDVLKPHTDPDKQEFDDRKIQKNVQKALDAMAAEKVVPKREQLQEGRSIMTKVAGLARRVHASTSLRERFEELATKNASSEQRVLTKRVDTRWDSDYDCLESHVHFKLETQLLTADPGLKLKSYALSEPQWALADEMLTVLEIFKERTKRFSLAEVPLLHETLPELALMRSELEAVCNDSDDMSPLTRVAARAALLIYDKYIGKMTIESEMYYIAVVMCPTLKLKWFFDNGYSYNEIQKIRDIVTRRFHESYAMSTHEQVHSSNPQGAPETLRSAKRINKYLQRRTIVSTKPQSTEYDSIEQYLADDVVPEDVIAQHGGLIQYCTAQLAERTQVYSMALDYLSAPASSVDAERAFSNGRLMVNHLQHQMSSQTFQAKMAVGSWVGTPLLPDLTAAAAAIQATM